MNETIDNTLITDLEQRIPELMNYSLSWGLGSGLEHTNNGNFFWHWGDNIVFQNFVIASREQRNGVVILTNSANGLNICEEIVHKSIGGEHPAFRFLDNFQSYLA